MKSRAGSTSGFTLIEMLMTVAIVAIMGGLAVPLMTNVSDGVKLSSAARQVQADLQNARMTAVSANQPMRFRFDCPATGQYRMVELIGTPSAPAAADIAANRCGLSVYPYPPADNDPITRPNNDGPLATIDSTTSFTTSTTIEFWSDGTAHTNTGGTNPWPQIAGAGYTIVLTRNGKTANILVTGSGKVQLQ